MRLRMTKADYRRVAPPGWDGALARLRMANAIGPRSIDIALWLCDLASHFLLTGRPKQAASAYRCASYYAESEEGAQQLRAMAGELELGLLRTATVH